jgi:hypothetical protein
MQVKETISAGIVATSVMTAFSYAASAIRKQNFKEPALLSLFIERLTPEKNKLVRYSGWPVHYTLGCVWAGVYTYLLKQQQEQPGLKNAVLFGCFSGGLGVLIWKALFRNHPNSPKTAYGEFYRQLFFAHLLFALSLDKTYAGLTRKDAEVIKQ